MGGDFINVWDGATLHPRNNLAFFESDGTLLDYTLINSINGPIRKVLYDYETAILYLAGDFTSVQDKYGNNYSPKYVMAFSINPLDDTPTYIPLNVNPDNKVHDMTIIGRKIFLCGEFTGINSKYRPGIGAFNRTNFNVY